MAKTLFLKDHAPFFEVIVKDLLGCLLIGLLRELLLAL